MSTKEWTPGDEQLGRAAKAMEAETRRQMTEPDYREDAWSPLRLARAALTAAAPIEAERELRIESLKGALAFYADPKSYDAIGEKGTVRGPAWRIAEDNGEKARAALAVGGSK